MRDRLGGADGIAWRVSRSSLAEDVLRARELMDATRVPIEAGRAGASKSGVCLYTREPGGSGVEDVLGGSWLRPGRRPGGGRRGVRREPRLGALPSSHLRHSPVGAREESVASDSAP